MASARPGSRNLLTDVAGLRVGQARDAAVRTGVTVILPYAPAVCAVDVRGGGPGTRETDLLAPDTLVEVVDAPVLSGGSVHGLAAADGVAAWLGARGRGFRVSPDPGSRPPLLCPPPSCSTSPTAATSVGVKTRPISDSARRPPAEQQFAEIFNSLLLPHELGHYLQHLSGRSRKVDRWESEVEANRIAIAFWSLAPSDAEQLPKRIENFVGFLGQLPDPVPDGMQPRDYSTPTMNGLATMPKHMAGIRVPSCGRHGRNERVRTFANSFG